MLPNIRLTQLLNTDNPHLLNFQVKMLHRDDVLPDEFIARYQTPKVGEDVTVFTLNEGKPELTLYCQAADWPEFRQAVAVLWRHHQAEKLQRAMDGWKELPPGLQGAELTCRTPYLLGDKQQ